MSSTEQVGTAQSLWRYAVKSMRGEEVDNALVADGGIVGDRAYALIDQASGKVASAKMPKKWGKLIELGASFLEPPSVDAPAPAVRITWPTGTSVVSSEGDCDVRLSEALGRSVAITTVRPETVSVERLDPLDADGSILDIGALMMEGRFSDYAAIHLLTTATLAKLSEHCPRSQFDTRRFRPNIVIEPTAGQSGFVENDWVGRIVTIGEDVRLRVTDPTPRCAVPTLAQGALPRDPEVLSAIVKHNKVAVPVLDGQELPCVGVYGFVLQGGVVRKGDPIGIE